jgi:hypothetical protein
MALNEINERNFPLVAVPITEQPFSPRWFARPKSGHAVFIFERRP